ncbi:hypothetical protein N9J72_02450 [Candidatus Gracilibacteria bacterium]|nr:hypothetical protein [Candidatus Gracilibacteria bacterium]
MYKISFLLCVFLFITSCGQSQTDIDAAKQKLLGPSVPSETSTGATASGSSDVVQESVEGTDEELDNDEQVVTSGTVQIIPQTAEQFLDFDDIDESELINGELEISGNTVTKVDKIQVLFSNFESNFPNDDYTLQTFEAGDRTFRYVASSRNKVLDFGENTYTFRAYSGNEITETRIRVRVNSEIQEQADGGETTRDLTPMDGAAFENLPKDTAYGEAMKLGENSFTYSQIKGLEISQESFENPSCATLTDFLRTRINNWFYWNTCRDLVAGKGIFYNVIRLEGDEYVYERHYVDFENGFYGTYELERGTGVSQDDVAAKNTELRDTPFESTSVVDGLMRDIVNS